MTGIDITALIPEYLAEVREHLAALERGLLALEATPEGKARYQAVNTIFRSAHTIKGSSRLMGYQTVGEVAHALEDVLDAVRDRRLAAGPGMIDTLLRAVDYLRQAIERPPDSAEGDGRRQAVLGIAPVVVYRSDMLPRLLVPGFVLALIASAPLHATDWPAWRGPDANGATSICVWMLWEGKNGVRRHSGKSMRFHHRTPRMMSTLKNLGKWGGPSL